MQQSPTIVFRADGNAQIGLGHVMRCLALADMLAPDFICQFALHQPSPGLVSLFQEKQIPLIGLQTQDVPEFIALIQPDDLVVLDGYWFDEPFQRAVREACRTLIFIDDLLMNHQVADVIINHTAGITETDYNAEPHTRFLLGPQYALVNPVFQAKELVNSSRTVLVNLGGADPMNLSHQLVNWLVTEQPDRPIRVVLGGANPHRELFRDFPVDQVTVLSGLSVVQMAHEIESCQLAIVSCSTISYEVATVGRPFIGIQTANNQTRLASFLADQSLAVGVLSVPLSMERLTRLLNEATPNEGIVNQRRYLDGQAGQRFRAIFSRLVQSQ